MLALPPGNISVTSQLMRYVEPPASFDGATFGGGIMVGMTYVFIPIGFALELIEDREVE